MGYPVCCIYGVDNTFLSAWCLVPGAPHAVKIVGGGGAWRPCYLNTQSVHWIMERFAFHCTLSVCGQTIVRLISFISPFIAILNLKCGLVSCSATISMFKNVLHAEWLHSLDALVFSFIMLY